MVAYGPVFRAGILRLISLARRGTIGELKSINLNLHMPPDYIRNIDRLEHDHEAYHNLSILMEQYICLLNRLCGTDSFEAKVDRENSDLPYRVGVTARGHWLTIQN